MPSGLATISATGPSHRDFINNYLIKELSELKADLQNKYPRIFLILGNDDSRFEETAIVNASTKGIFEYIHNRRSEYGDFQIYGYAFVPPTPFMLKDWERYDVSRYVDPGAISPEEGYHAGAGSASDAKYRTIAKDLDRLAGDRSLSNAVFLFHSPPYMTNLDRAALDGKMVDHVPLDVHIGSIAIRRFIEKRQPLLTLHGHVHESAGLTGNWRDKIGRTACLSAAHDGPELALVKFALEDIEHAERELL